MNDISYITLPCGCKISPSFTHSMCPQHLNQYRDSRKKWIDSITTDTVCENLDKLDEILNDANNDQKPD